MRSHTQIVLGALAIALLSGFSPAESQEDPSDASAIGSICIAPLPKHAEAADHDYPGGLAPREYTYDFSIQIDSEKPVAVPTDKPVLIAEIDDTTKHLIRIRDADRIIESFWFSFSSRGSNELCLAYGPWYQTWQLEPPRPGVKWCKCEKQEK